MSTWQDLVIFLQHLPTSEWTEKEIGELLSQVTPRTTPPVARPPPAHRAAHRHSVVVTLSFPAQAFVFKAQYHRAPGWAGVAN